MLVPPIQIGVVAKLIVEFGIGVTLTVAVELIVLGQPPGLSLAGVCVKTILCKVISVVPFNARV